MGQKLTLSMYSTTDAIVLSLQPYSDKAHVLHAYTRAGGRVNYMVYGLGRKKQMGLYAPLSLIQITASHPASGLPTLREATSLSGAAVYQSEGRSISETVYQCNGLSGAAGLYKQTIRLFISEILFHVLRHPMPDEPMFDFLVQAVHSLAQTDEPQNFHIRFLIDFAAQLGFAIPEEAPSPITYNQSPITFTRAERQQALRALCAYFAEHVETWKDPKSLDVLTEVFDG